jgi:short-subunit dehydrogenase
MKTFQRRAALVTGASSGIGEAFARTLALEGVDVLLTSVPEEEGRLRAIAAELSGHGARAEVIPMDLAERDGPRRLQAGADELGFEPDMLVNSAGIGVSGRFAELPLDEQLRMIHVNVEALVALTGLYLPRMAARSHGAIVQVGSTAALQPMPYFGVYAASKAFVQSFGEAMWAEHRHAGVRVLTVCSGPVATPFHDRGGNGQPPRGIGRFLKRRYLTADMVVSSALRALERDRPTVVRRLPGVRFAYYPAAAAASVVPRRHRLIASEYLTRWLLLER